MSNARNVVESPYQPRPLSLDFHARKERFAIIVAHRRFGKTVMCINDLVDKALQCHLPFPKFAYVAPFYRQAKDIAWIYLKFYAAPITEKVMESELSVLLKNGATIKLFGADNPDSLRGNYFDGIIIDEYGQISPRLFGEIIAPALADRKGWCVFIGTPAGPNHFKELWDTSANDVRWFRRMYKATETNIIDEEELEMIRTMPGSDDNTFRQEMLCDFNAAVRGAYYGNQLNEMEVQGLMGDFPWDPDRPVLLAFDIGFTDDTSIWFYQYDGKTIRIIDFFSESGFSVDEVMDNLMDRPYAYGTFYLPHDAKNKSFQTGKSTLEQMRAHDAKCLLVPSLSVQDGIQAVRKTFPQMQFNTANPEVLKGVNALKIYQREFDDKKRIFKEKPLHNWASNPADAMRYLALAMNPAAARKEGKRVIRKEKPPPTSNVYTLDKLYAEREARKVPGRI